MKMTADMGACRRIHFAKEGVCMWCIEFGGANEVLYSFVGGFTVYEVESGVGVFKEEDGEA